MKVSNWTKVKSLLLKADRKRLSWLLLPMGLTSLANIFGIAFVIPFIAVVSNPGLIKINKNLSAVYDFFSFTSTNHFIIFLGMLALIILVLANGTASFTTWLSTRVVEQVRVRIAQALYEKYLNKPYEFHLNYNSSTLCNNLFPMVSRFTNGFIFQLMQLIASGLTVFAIFGFIVYLDPKLALFTSLLLGGVYLIIYQSVKRSLIRSGEELTTSSELCFRLASESFGGIKDIKLKGSEKIFKKLFFPQQMKQAKSNAALQYISLLPRYVLEVIAFGGAIVLILAMIISGKNTSSILPLTSAYVYAGYRLMPAMQQILAAVGSLKVMQAPLDQIYNSFSNDVGWEEKEPTESPDRLSFKNELLIKNLSYRYTGHEKLILKDVNISVKHNEIVGLIGATGSGKTTLIDIILGLLKPTAGMLSVDGVDLDSQNKVVAWQQSMGYVPQFIFLSDSTIKENIGFGEDITRLDHARIEHAAKIASIHDFIVNELPDGYETKVGERGVKLSGGQIQRIGIARAIYRNPSILVLDEATSSLDNQTEAEVMKAIYNMKEKITIIIIAHRLSTVAACDKIFMLEKGRIIDEGTFRELADRYSSLRQGLIEPMLTNEC